MIERRGRDQPDPDKEGREAVESPSACPTDRNAIARGGADAQIEQIAEPDAAADREAPAARPDRDKRAGEPPPLNIKQIEEMEDDAPGGLSV